MAENKVTEIVLWVELKEIEEFVDKEDRYRSK